MTMERNPDMVAAFHILYEARWTDARIGRALGRCTNSIRLWRNQEGLIGNNVRRAKIEEVAFLELYRSGASDGAIGRHFETGSNAIGQWRKKRGLPPNIEQKKGLDRQSVAKVNKMLREGASRSQAREATGVGKQSVANLSNKLSGQQLRPKGQNTSAIRAAVLRDTSILPRIKRAVGRFAPPEVVEDAVSDLYLAVLEGKLSVELIEAKAAAFRNKAYGDLGSKYGMRSIDEENEEGFSIADRIEDAGALDAFDAIFESEM